MDSKQSNKYELVYFRFKGRSNMIRLMLTDQGVAFTETNVELEDWPAVKAKYPFGQLPLLIVNGAAQLAQSHAIIRYLAREHGLMGDSNIEQAQVDMWIELMLDVRAKFYDMVRNNFEAGLKPFVDSLPDLMAPFESRLASREHLVLDRLTLADYVLFDLLFLLQALKSGCDMLEGTPVLRAFYARFGDRPGIRGYMLSDEFKTMRTSLSERMA